MWTILCALNACNKWFYVDKQSGCIIYQRNNFPAAQVGKPLDDMEYAKYCDVQWDAMWSDVMCRDEHSWKIIR